jgi:hypothetical protein
MSEMSILQQARLVANDSLANHYGFTDEELDFISNYDTKHRMRLGSSEEDVE